MARGLFAEGDHAAILCQTAECSPLIINRWLFGGTAGSPTADGHATGATGCWRELAGRLPPKVFLYFVYAAGVLAKHRVPMGVVGK